MKILFTILICLSSLVCFAETNVAVVLDCSGSMSGDMGSSTRMDVAKDALISTLNVLPEDTNVGILVFSARQGDGWLSPISRINKLELFEKIKSLSPHGGTPLGQFMKTGADELLKLRESNHNQGIYKLLIVTDGEESRPKYIDVYLPDILSRGIIVDVIGLDMNSQHSLATKVANYSNVRDKKSLSKALQLTFSEVSDKNASDFELLDGLSVDFASKLINSLCQYKNHPIGEPEPVISSENNTEGVENNSEFYLLKKSLKGVLVVFLFCLSMYVICATVNN